MAADLLMEVEGLKGEAGDSTFENAMALDGWSFSMSRGAHWEGPNRTISDATVTDITVTCGIDQMVVGIAALCLAPRPAGKHVMIIQRRPGGGAVGETFLVISLEEVVFTGLSQSAGPTGLPQCLISMNFTRVSYDYFPQSSRGGQSGAAFNWRWEAATDD